MAVHVRNLGSKGKKAPLPKETTSSGGKMGKSAAYRPKKSSCRRSKPEIQAKAGKPFACTAAIAGKSLGLRERYVEKRERSRAAISPVRKRGAGPFRAPGKKDTFLAAGKGRWREGGGGIPGGAQNPTKKGGTFSRPARQEEGGGEESKNKTGIL